MNQSDQKIRQSSQHYFEEELENYGDVVPPSGQDDQHLVNLLKILLGGKNTFRLLDIGCGIGYVAKTVQALYPKSVLYGIDISQQVIDTAIKQDASKKIHFKVGNEINIPYADHTFDFAVCRFSIHHYPQMIQHLKEVHRILENNGTYLIIDVVPDAGLYDQYLNDIHVKVEPDSGHVKFYTLNEYEDILNQSDFNMVKVEYFPLVLEFPKSNSFYKEIKESVTEYQQMISFKEYDDRFSFTLKAAGIFAKI